MIIPRALFLNIFLGFVLIASGQNNKSDSIHPHDGIYADFNTNKGKIIVLLEYKKAPVTVANFIGLAEGTITNVTYPKGISFYNGSIWHRVVKGHVIQGGEPATVKDPANSDVNSIGYEIPNEISDLSHNKAGMTGMANEGPNTNTCEYYITLADRSYLDGNYTLFGEVVEGMDIVNTIEKGDTTRSITIRRVGTEAEQFIVNDSTFKSLLDDLWRKVNNEIRLRKLREQAYISANWTDLDSMKDGLRFKVISEGKGSKPSDGSVVTVRYSGKLINDLAFVSSSDEGKPVPGPVPAEFTHTIGQGGLITGLSEALKDMKAGEKRLLIIPPNLGYGEKTAYYGKEIQGKKRFVISPGETLILEVTLVNFN